MDLLQLRAFYEVVNCGSVTGASRILCMSQPAVSRQIRNLENALGIQLFSRHSRGVRLTEAGRCLLYYVEKSLTLLDNAEKALAAFRDLETGSVTLGASTTIGNYLLPGWLACFNKEYPNIEVALLVDNSNRVIQGVLKEGWKSD